MFLFAKQLVCMDSTICSLLHETKKKKKKIQQTDLNFVKNNVKDHMENKEKWIIFCHCLKKKGQTNNKMNGGHEVLAFKKNFCCCKKLLFPCSPAAYLTDE